VKILQGKTLPKVTKIYSEDERREPLRELLRKALPEQDTATNEEVAALSGTQLRDRLIAYSPLDMQWIKRVNQARITTLSPEFLSALVPACPCVLAIMSHVAEAPARSSHAEGSLFCICSLGRCYVAKCMALVMRLSSVTESTMLCTVSSGRGRLLEEERGVQGWLE
jgi:hypothetical protein